MVPWRSDWPHACSPRVQRERRRTEDEMKRNRNNGGQRRPWSRLLLGGGACYLGWRLFRQIRARDLRGKVVLFTGGSRGLGLALARCFAKEGCRIALCARDEQELERARVDIDAL